MFTLSRLAICVAGIGAFAPQVMADTAPTSTSETIERLSIYASRTPQQLANLNASVSLLTRADLDLLAAQDLPSVLQQLPGVYIARQGGRGQTSSVFVRGSNTKYLLVLINGMRVGSATLGYMDLSQLPLDSIEQIELIRGPRAALYGADAVSGVLAITTRQTQGVASTLRAGSDGLAEASVRGNYQQDGTQLGVQTGFARADGIHVLDAPGVDTDRDGFRQRYLQLNAEHQAEQWRLGYQGAFHRGFNEYDFNPAWGLGADQATTAQDSQQVQLNYLQALAETSLQHQLKVGQNRDDSVNQGNGALYRYITDRTELDYQAHWQYQSGADVVFGANRTADEVATNGDAFVRDHRVTQSVFASSTYQLGAADIDAAIRHDHISAYGSQATYQWGVRYDLLPSVQLRFNQGSAFKVPTYNDLYYPGFGNPELRPETSLSREVGLRLNSAKGWSLDAVHFERQLHDMIAYNTTTWQSENIAKAAIHGLEYTLSFQQDNLRHEWQASYSDGRNLTTSAVLPSIPRQKYQYQLQGQFGDWQWQGTVQYRGAVYNPASDQSSLPSVTTVSGTVGYEINRQHTVRVAVENLLDKTYRTDASYWQPGRSVSVSWQSYWF